MLPFRVTFHSGAPTYEQLVYAVKKAIVAGALRPGDGFPSVRNLSQELGINPNTAQKAVAALVAEGLLTVKPGIGTLVAQAGAPSKEQLSRLLDNEVERLVVEGRKLHLDCEDLTRAIRSHWNRLAGD